jgi:hypothetical protein
VAFKIKRNDRRPYLDAQFFQPDGITPLNISSASKVSMVCRLKGTGVDDPPKFKADCIVVDAALGRVQYRWSATDTDTPGTFEYEFEISWTGGELQTLPQDGYFSLIILDDVG